MSGSERVEIDGSSGEGGGQILRSALALSLVTGRACHFTKIRAGRRKPGLLRQHLTAVEAAAAIGSASVEGAVLGSHELSFEPGRVRGGSYRFSVGTAGSTTLVLQTLLPALLVADGPSEVLIEGGTHNPFAPPFDFLDRVFLPLLERMGGRARAELERPGFHPVGGGSVRLRVEPGRLAPLELTWRGEVERVRAAARVSNLPLHIAERELATVSRELALSPDAVAAETVQNAAGPGNVLIVEIVSAGLTELFTGFGRRGLPAERLASGLVAEVREYIDSGVPVGSHLADQLLLPLAMAGGGRYRTLPPTAHTWTNVETVRRFLEVPIEIREDGREGWLVEIGAGR